jgi:hypothetical protein
MQFVQNSFQGGVDTVSLETQIADDAYQLVINGRNRFSAIEPIYKHREITNRPAGLLQGTHGVGNVLIIFVAGKAYYQEDGKEGWIQVPNFLMSRTASEYWTETVPASYMNFVRKLDVNRNIKAGLAVTTDFKVSGTPAAIVVQDGTNQPWLIMYDSVNQVFTSRRAKRYDEWKNESTNADDREYVPRGKQMMYLNGILFIVSTDTKRCYRSVTGRPLDFVIAVDINGNKLSAESQGGAEALSFAFDYDFITCLRPANIPNSFIYGTAHNVRIITMDFQNTIYDEPRFYVSAQIEAGICNQFSLIEVNGDYTFIDREGIISFNAVEQLQTNGRNSIFSLQIAKQLSTVKKQRNPICFKFSNYAIFNVDTAMGNVMAVYDTLLNKWTSFDITDVTSIKRVAIVETTTETKLYVVTRHNELFELFGDRDKNVYLCQVMTRGHIPINAETEHKTEIFRTLFEDAAEDGNALVTELVDGEISQQKEQPLNSSIAGIKYPVRPPVMPNSISHIDSPHYAMKDGRKGSIIKFLIQWNIYAKLIKYQVNTNESTGVSNKQKQTTISNTYGNT